MQDASHHKDLTKFGSKAEHWVLFIDLDKIVLFKQFVGFLANLAFVSFLHQLHLSGNVHFFIGHALSASRSVHAKVTVLQHVQFFYVLC